MGQRSGRARLISAIDKTGYFIEMGTGSLCVLFFATMATVTFVGVIFRYVLNNPLQWGNELARFMMLWAGFIGINIAMRKNEHITIDIVIKMLPSRLSKFLGYIVDILIGYFLVILLIRGYHMATSTFMTASAMPVSMFWIYSAVPLGALLTLIQLFFNVFIKILSEFGPAGEM